MLDRLTNGRLRSTTHRVVNPRGEAAYRSRYSMPFFLHFRPDFTIETLESCIDPDSDEAAPAPISSHDFLMQRLREIRDWRERLGMGVSGGPVRVQRDPEAAAEENEATSPDEREPRVADPGGGVEIDFDLNWE